MNTSCKLQNQCDDFNKKHPIGSKVVVYKIKGDENSVFVDEIKHDASIMGGHTAMCWLKKNGSYDLTFVKGSAEPKNDIERLCNLYEESKDIIYGYIGFNTSTEAAELLSKIAKIRDIAAVAIKNNDSN